MTDTYREVRNVGADARSILLRRRYAATVDDVWHACTDPDRLKRWFLPVTGDLRAGGTFQLEGNAGGEILTCEPPRRLRVTWVYGDGPSSEVEVRLSASGPEETIVELEHGPVPTVVEMDGRRIDVILNDPQTGIWGMGTGWDMGLAALDAFLRGELPATTDPAALESNPQIIEMANNSGAAWAEAVAAAAEKAKA